MTYKTRYELVKTFLENTITLNDNIIKNHLDEIETNDFYQRLLDERNYFMTIVSLMNMVVECDSVKEYHDRLIEEKFI